MGWPTLWRQPVVYRVFRRLKLGALRPALFTCPGKTGQFWVCAGGRPCPQRVLLLWTKVWVVTVGPQTSCTRAEATLVCCGFAGAHLNAAITLTHCLLGNLPWRKLPAYLIGQFLGSFTAAATVFGLYYGMVVSFIMWVSVGTGFSLNSQTVKNTSFYSTRHDVWVRRRSSWFVGQTFIA